MHEKVAYRSRVAYVHLVAVVVVTALVALVLGSVALVIVGVFGLVWVLLTLRSGIEVTDDGFKVRGLFRTRSLDWSQTDAFIVVGYSGETANFGNRYEMPSPGAATRMALANREHMFSLVAVVTNHGERIKVPGTASTLFDAAFPARAASQLNSVLKSHNPAATAD